jgi:hypothetical protein
VEKGYQLGDIVEDYLLFSLAIAKEAAGELYATQMLQRICRGLGSSGSDLAGD